jgi:pimeloyl-ACP methyl ester carboxylesterase
MSSTPVPSEFEHRMRMPDGRWLAYADYGDPAGRPVLSFHGGLSCRLEVRFAAAFCRDEGIRLISIDRPGIGLSDYQCNRTILDWPEDIAHLALMLGINRFAVLGWSAGGPYALACASRIPHLLTHVGTIGCMAPVHGRPETVRESGLQVDRILFPLVRRSPWIAAQFLRATNYLSPALLKRNLLREVVCPADQAVIESINGAEMCDFFYEALRQGPWGTVQDYRILGGPWGFSLQEITKEVHLWQGDEDRIVPPCQARWLADRIPDARLHLVPGQGHFLLRNCLSDILTTLTDDPVQSPAIPVHSQLSLSYEGR